VTVVVDTSALLAVVFGEPDAARYLDALVAHCGQLVLSTASLAELLRDLPVVAVDLDASQADFAVQAWRRFGKGRHPAGPNLADCYAYGLAAS